MAVNIPKKSNLPNEAVPWGRKVADKVASLDRQVTALEQSAHNTSRVSSAQMEVIAGQLAQISEQQTALNSQQSQINAQVAELNARNVELISIPPMTIFLDFGMGNLDNPLRADFTIPGSPGGARNAVVSFSTRWIGTSEYNSIKFSYVDLRIGGTSLDYESKRVDYSPDKLAVSELELQRWSSSDINRSFFLQIPSAGLTGYLEFYFSRGTTGSQSSSSLTNPVLIVQKGNRV